ncbi:hypothetical protein Cfor_08523, partial [Coptotermes formosanus]
MIFLQDGASPHHARETKNILHATFPGRLIGREGSIPRQLRSPVSTCLDFLLWRLVKNYVQK